MTTPEAEGARLYLQTPTRVDEAEAEVLAALLAAHPVACVRLSLSDTDEDGWRRAATLLQPACHTHDVALVITDHFRLVRPLGLDGVHIADPRGSVRKAREALGNDAIVGAFAGTSRHAGMTAAEIGADYVSFGPLGDPGPLGDGSRADPELFTWWAEMIETPVVAEGGIGAEEARMVAATADFVVPDPAIWQAHDPVAALAAIVDALAT